MAYKKQNFVNNSTVLTAEIMDHIEAGIIANEQNINKLSQQMAEVVNKPVARIGEVTLTTDGWSGTGNLFSQIVTIDGITPNSQVDLTPDAEQLAIFYEKDLTFVTENDNGVVTVYAIGQKPQNDYTIQVTITEVA